MFGNDSQASTMDTEYLKTIAMKQVYDKIFHHANIVNSLQSQVNWYKMDAMAARREASAFLEKVSHLDAKICVLEES